jgi:hypothetical protein
MTAREQREAEELTGITAAVSDYRTLVKQAVRYAASQQTRQGTSKVHGDSRDQLLLIYYNFYSVK